MQVLKNQALDTIPGMVWSCLPNGRIEYLNQPCLEYAGLTLEEITARGWPAVIHPEDLGGLVDGWQSALKSGQPGEAEARLRRHDGKFRWFLFRCAPLRDKTGRITKWYGTNTDIEELKRAEAGFRRTEAILAEGQRLSHTGSWAWNPGSGEMIWSKERFRILGLEPETTKPTLALFWERVHPEDRLGLREAFDSAVRDKRDFEKEYRIVTPDWVIKHLHSVGHAVVSESGEFVEFIGTTIDITGRKRAEERAHDQKEAIRLALNAFVEELDVDWFLHHVILGLTKQFQAVCSELWLFDDSTENPSVYMTCQCGKVTRHQADGTTGLQSKDVRTLWDPSKVGRIPRIIQFPAQESLLEPAHRALLREQSIKTLVVLPLVLGEQNLGFFELRFRPEAQFIPDDLDRAQALVHHATLALQLSRLARRTEQMAVMEERTRIAREIHDTLAQAFAGIILHSEALSASLAVTKARSKKSLSQIQKLARSGLEGARRSVQALRPKALDGTTLAKALGQAAKRLAVEAKMLCEFKQRGKVFRLAEEIQNELFRIAQEAMTNVRKHARAKSTWITLEFKTRQVILAIQDNGIGFSATNSSMRNPGYGFATMRERAQHIGGRLRVETLNGGGTTISVSVPLTKKVERSSHTK